MKINLERGQAVHTINASFNVFEAQVIMSKMSSIINLTSMHPKLDKYKDDRKNQLPIKWKGNVSAEEVRELFIAVEQMQVMFSNMFADTPAIQDVSKTLFEPWDESQHALYVNDKQD